MSINLPFINPDTTGVNAGHSRLGVDSEGILFYKLLDGTVHRLTQVPVVTIDNNRYLGKSMYSTI